MNPHKHTTHSPERHTTGTNPSHHVPSAPTHQELHVGTPPAPPLPPPPVQQVHAQPLHADAFTVGGELFLLTFDENNGARPHWACWIRPAAAAATHHSNPLDAAGNLYHIKGLFLIGFSREIKFYEPSNTNRTVDCRKLANLTHEQSLHFDRLFHVEQLPDSTEP